MGVPKIYGSIEVGTQCFVGFLIGEAGCSPFIRPCELITFLASVNNIFRQLRTEFVEVNSKFRLAIFIQSLSDTLRKQCSYLRHIALGSVMGFHF